MNKFLAGLISTALLVGVIAPVASANENQKQATATEIIIIEPPDKVTTIECIEIAMSVLPVKKTDEVSIHGNLNSKTTTGFYRSPKELSKDITYTCYSGYIVVNTIVYAKSDTSDEEKAQIEVDFQNHLAADALRVKFAAFLKTKK
jgi:flagellar hook protein FlgE